MKMNMFYENVSFAAEELILNFVNSGHSITYPKHL